MDSNGRPLVFVTVGTDHHPFDRLVAWTDAWMASGRAGTAACLIQTGTSKPPMQAEGRDYLRYDEMVDAMTRAVAVVCHGGPATIMDARRVGKVPIVIPRAHRLGEHVDDHQQHFAARMAEAGQIHLARSEEELHALLDRALADPAGFAVTEQDDAVAEAVARFEDLVDALVRRRPARRVTGRDGKVR
jgi:UDP-N-acetylglucosamine transferase subunit ALG13